MRARFQTVLCAVVLSLLLLPSVGVCGDDVTPPVEEEVIAGLVSGGGVLDDVMLPDKTSLMAIIRSKDTLIAKIKLEAERGANYLESGKYDEVRKSIKRCLLLCQKFVVGQTPPPAPAKKIVHRVQMQMAPQEPRFAESRLAPFQTPTNAEQLIRLLESSIAGGDKAGAEEILTKIERLIPADPRIVWMQRVVANMPGQKNQLVLDLGDGVELEMVRIEPGAFMMGAADGDPGEGPVHRVVISKPFYIGKYPVTQKQWETIMGDNPSHYRGPRNPVECVNLGDCETFLGKLSEKFAKEELKFSLPTSAQWEYACRAGATTRFHFGDNESQLRYYGWFGLNSDGRTHPVGEKKPNAWGLYDMHGNVWEVCSDFWDNGDYYANSPTRDPEGASASWARMLRGGSYSASIARCRSASRFPCNPSVRIKNAGLRVICTQ